MRHKNIITTVIVLLMTISLANCNFTLTSFSVTPNYAQSVSSEYNFTFTAINPFVSNFNLQILLPNQYVVSTVSSCSFYVNNILMPSSICSLNSNLITFSNININQTISSYFVRFFTATAKYANTDSLSFSYYNVTTSALVSNINTNYVTVTISNAVMTCSTTSSSAVVGATSSYTLSYTPIVAIQPNTILQIQLSPWSNYNLTNFITTNTTQICNGTCTVSSPSSNNNLYEIVTYSSLFPNSISANSNLSLVLNQIKNPPSTQSVSITITLFVQISSFTQYSYISCISSLSVSQPSSFGLINFVTTNQAISATNIITLNAKLTNPIFSNSYLSITTPLTLTYKYNQYNIGSTPTSVAAGVNQLLINNLTPVNPTSSPTILVLSNFTLINPPYANKPATIVFTTQGYVSGTYYLVDQSSVSITCQPSTITTTSLSILSSSINTYTTYTIYFVNINPLIINSFIQLVLPSQVATTNVTCSLITISSTCVILNSSTFQITLNTQVNTNTNFTITLTNILNPPTTTSTSSINIYTYYQDSLSLVDQLTSGLTITATSAPLNSVQLIASNLNVGSIATYTLTIQNKNILPATSTINVTIPTTSFVLSYPTLTSFQINTVNVSSCVMTTSLPFTLSFTSCISSNIPASSTIKIILGGITNPSSTKPTNSWTVQTYYNNLLMQYLLTNIIVTMNNPIALSFFQITPLSLIANQLTNYTFSMTFIYQHYTGDRILIQLPTGVSFGSGFVCSSLTTGVSISCSSSTIQTMEVDLTYLTTNYNNSLSFVVTQVNNFWYANTQTISIQTTTNDTNFYYVEQASTTINYQAASISASVSNDNRIILTGNSTVAITLQSPFTLSQANQSLISITIIIPSSLTPINSSQCTTSYTSANCILTSSQLYTVTNVNTLSSPIIITFNAATSYFTQTSPLLIDINYGSSLVAYNTTVTLSPYCTNPCKQCGNTPTQCLSCLQIPYTQNITYFPDSNICVITCPSLYYLNGIQCSQCSTVSCLNCVTTSTQCTSCPSGKYLYNSTCITSCPTQYFRNNTLNQCIQCQSPCLTCTNTTSCLSCISGFYLDITTSCVTTCSNVSYIGINGVCVQCTNNCITCSMSVSNCTSCDTTQYTLFNFTCTRTCPVNFYKGDTGCQACVSPCVQCLSSSQCLTCISNYYLYLNTTCTQTCPAGYLAVINICSLCSSQCATCSNSLSNCTSCASGMLFYFSSCISTCPTNTYPYNRTCTTCISPCVQCTSSPSSCLSCIDGLVLINQTCINNCPPTGYYQVNSTCIQCQTNCLSCNSPVNCLICADGYNQLSGGCIANCPSNYPIVINRTCTACESQCASCSITSYNCTSCVLYYFSYSYTCVQSCPLTYYSNIITYTCDNGLSNKIVFFPFFIMSMAILLIIIVSKIMVHITSFFTSMTAFLGLIEPAMWLFLLSLFATPIKQPNINYIIPTGLLIVSVVISFILNGIFFYFNSKKIEQDDVVRDWCKNNVNHVIVVLFRYLALLTLKFYRLVYSRLFGVSHLSVPYKKPQNAFRLATIFTILSLLLCQIPALAAAFSLVYSKVLKDQIFYSSVECLAVTAFCALMSLIDIRKDEKYFQENQYMVAKKYVEKVNDSGNNLEDVFEMPKEEASLDGQNYRGQTGGKFLFTKRDPSSFSSNDLFFEEAQSEATDAMPKKKLYRINIFNPIMEEEAQYYQQEKFQNQQFQTLAKIQQENRKNQSEHSGDQVEHFLINGGNLNGSKIGRIVKNKGFQSKKKMSQLKSSRKFIHKQINSSRKKGIIDTLYGEIIDEQSSLDKDNLQKYKVQHSQRKQKVQSKTFYNPKHKQQERNQLPYQTIYSQGQKFNRQHQEDLQSLDRKIITQFAVRPQQEVDDSKSLLQYRDIRKKWNKIISKRQKLAQQIFGKQLQKIEQPPQFAKEYDKQYDNEEQSQIEDQQGQIRKKVKRRRGKKIKNNDELQKIYLQRLTEKKKRQERDLDF